MTMPGNRSAPRLLASGGDEPNRRSRSRRRLGILVGLGAVVALAATNSPTVGFASAGGHRADRTVCDGLTPDLRFAKEARWLGVEHACEHLQERELSRESATAMTTLAPVKSLASTDPSAIGQWSNAANPGTQTIGIASVVLHTGKVLLFGGRYSSGGQNTAAYLIDPVTFTGHEVPAPAAVFCGGITPLADGRLLSVGGTSVIPKGIVDVWLFDPVTEQWIRQPDTPLGRYYPTTTRLPDGRVVIAAGTEADGKTSNPTVEVYTPPAPGQSVGSINVVSNNHKTGTYPHQWVMPDGNMLQVDGGRRNYKLTVGSWAWSPFPLLPETLGQGSAGMLLPGGPAGSSQVAVIGGSVKGVASKHTMDFDYSNPGAGWKLGQALPTPRAHMNVVQVPDGTAFGIGGNTTGLYGGGETQTLFYDPATDTWTNMAVQAIRRAYHSTAVLLPDGRIMSAGDTGPGGGGQLIDFYSPPYLFQGPRPTIDSSPAQLSYGQSFNIATSGPGATTAVLMAPGSTTHDDEMNARRVALAVSPATGGLSATAPPSANVAPPGYYMLFVLTASGIPSEAKWVYLGN